MNREQRRAAAKQAKKNGPDFEEKVALFGQLGDECLTCLKPFDKKNKEMVMSWHVVVREKEEEVRLYCPDCWDKATKITRDFQKYLKEKDETDA